RRQGFYGSQAMDPPCYFRDWDRFFGRAHDLLNERHITLGWLFRCLRHFERSVGAFFTERRVRERNAPRMSCGIFASAPWGVLDQSFPTAPVRGGVSDTAHANAWGS